jgi:N-acetylmuramoyl-L-alanine amidase
MSAPATIRPSLNWRPRRTAIPVISWPTTGGCWKNLPGRARHESHLLANTVNANLFQSLKTVNPELENRGVKMAPAVVLLGTQMPAILVEVSALSNEGSQSVDKRGLSRKIALALFNGIHAYAKSLNGAPKGS